MSKMKYSGVKWIGNIPKEWGLKRIKYSLKQPITDGPHETPEFLEDGIPFLSVDSIQNGKLVFDNRFISIEDAKRYDKKCRPQLGDILMAKAASVGKISIVETNRKFQIWSPLALIRTEPKKLNNYFLKYYLESTCGQEYIDSYSTMNTQKNIAMQDIEKIKIIMPCIKEQKLIADFLDIKVRDIEDIIVDLNKQIELLKSIKQSTIDKYISGKNKLTNKNNTGIDWIKEIPVDWKLIPIKNVANVHSSTRVFEEEYMEYGIPFFRTKEIVELANNKEISLELFISEEKYKTLKKNKPKVSDLLISSIGTIGEVWLCDGRDFWYKDGNITQIDSNSKFDSRFMKYFIKSSIFVESIKYYESTTTISALTIEKIKRIKMPFPSLSEQTEIADLLDSKCKKIDEIINKKIEELNKIEQYKKSVIYEYVTGKKRVKGAEELYG